MAVVRGIREKVHLPLYDAKTFKAAKSVSEQVTGNLIKFFVDVQNKTKLETNQQESSVLSHYNTYEARALRIVVQSEEAEGWEEDQQKKWVTDFIYNSVTTLFVGEKVMIQAPTFMFPSGAGPANDAGITNGSTSPEATFRFAEPVSISHQQNFRVEIEFPGGLPNGMGDKCVNGKVWAVIDGYITRDVQ